MAEKIITARHLFSQNILDMYDASLEILNTVHDEINKLLSEKSESEYIDFPKFEFPKYQNYIPLFVMMINNGKRKSKYSNKDLYNNLCLPKWSASMDNIYNMKLDKHFCNEGASEKQEKYYDNITNIDNEEYARLEKEKYLESVSSECLNEVAEKDIQCYEETAMSKNKKNRGINLEITKSKGQQHIQLENSYQSKALLDRNNGIDYGIASKQKSYEETSITVNRGKGNIYQEKNCKQRNSYIQYKKPLYNSASAVQSHPLKLNKRDLSKTDKNILRSIGIFSDNGDILPEVYEALEQAQTRNSQNSKNKQFRKTRDKEENCILNSNSFDSVSEDS